MFHREGLNTTEGWPEQKAKLSFNDADADTGTKNAALGKGKNERDT